MNEKNIPDVILERFLLKELDEKTMAEIKAELEINPELQKRLQTMQESNREILSGFSSSYVAAEIQKKTRENQNYKNKQKSQRKRSKKWKVPVAAFGFVAAMALIFLLIPEISLRYKVFHELKDTRLKGNAIHLYLYRKNQNQIDLLGNHSPAKKNDLIQIAYFSQSETFGMIFSIDGRGNVTLHLPENSQEAAHLETGKKVLLNNSYELDDAPFYETFYFVSSARNFNVGKTLEAMKKIIEAQKESDSQKHDFTFETSANVVSITLDKER